MEIKDIKSINFPFTLYDFFGYLFPGGTFWVLMLFSNDIHLLLQVALGKAQLNENSHFFFEAFAASFNKSVVLGLVLIILAAYITGHVIASFSSWVFERIMVERFLKYPTTNLFGLTPKPVIQSRLGWFMRQIQFIKRAFFGKYKRAYSEGFIKEFDEKYQAIFSLSATDSSDKFWLCFEYIAYHCPVTLSRTLHFLNLYGFSRNLSMTFTIAGIFQLAWLQVWEAGIFFGFAFFLYINYLKLLRRTNDEVFRGFYVKTVGNLADRQYDTIKTY